MGCPPKLAVHPKGYHLSDLPTSFTYGCSPAEGSLSLGVGFEINKPYIFSLFSLFSCLSFKM